MFTLELSYHCLLLPKHRHFGFLGWQSCFMCASLSLQVPEAEVEKAQKAVAAKAAHLQEQFHLKETSLTVSLGDAKSTPSKTITADSAQRLISLLLVAPHGVAKMSHAVEGRELAF